MMMITRWEQVTKQDLTDGHSHPVNKEPTTDYMPQVIVENNTKKKEINDDVDDANCQMGPMVGRAVTVLIEPSNAAHKVVLTSSSLTNEIQICTQYTMQI